MTSEFIGVTKFSKKGAENLIKIYNLVHKLGDRNKFLEKMDPISAIKFFRSISFQQFWFQQKLDFWIINHQLQIFHSHEWYEYQINDIFLKHSGLSIYEFLELFYATIAYFSDKKHKIFTTNYYYSTIKNYSQIKVNNFLNLIS